MATPQKSGDTTTTSGDLIDTAAAFGNSLVRLAVTVTTWPAYVLPEKSRTEVIDATTEAFNTVSALHLSVLKAVLNSLSAATRSISKAIEPAPPTAKATNKVLIESAPPAAR